MAHSIANRKNQTGYTLLELLVTIAIIGLLSTITIRSLSKARARARDAKRIADITQIRNVLELYRAENNEEYPPRPTQVQYRCSETIGGEEYCYRAENPNWIPDLLDYANPLPMDPRGFPSYAPYEYRASPLYGYILTFKLDSQQHQDECGVAGTTPQFSSRCEKRP